MLRSMTGYGTWSQEDELCAQVWEIKSVNGKQLSLRWRLPGFASGLEPAWEREVRQWASRGRVDIWLDVQVASPEVLPMSLNRAVAAAMLDQLRQVARAEGESFQPDYNRLLGLSSLWKERPVSDQDALAERLSQGLRQALRQWTESRRQEGRALQTDLMERMERVAGWVGQLEEASSGLAERRFGLLQERVARLGQEAGFEVDQDRMLQELALVSDKVDVTEELTRLRTHVGTLSRHLSEGSAGGRKLDFLLQECFREITTCGNKAQDSSVSQVVVDVKTEMEKCREQVQNLE